jgi:hypothetical protein
MLTWRKLLVLLEHLPPESALNTSMRNDAPEHELAIIGAGADPTRAKWSALESMLAAVLDEIRMSNWAYAQAHSEKKIKRPEPVPRPGINRRGKVMRIEDAMKIDPRLRGLSPEEAQAKLDSMRGGQ